MTTYETLESACKPLIAAYLDDLTKHDRQWIEANPDTPFLHFTGDTGTHLIQLIDPLEYPKKGERVPYLFYDADREHILDGVRQMVDCMPRVNRNSAIHHFDGKTLRKITQAKAVDIAAKYTRGVRTYWEMMS